MFNKLVKKIKTEYGEYYIYSSLNELIMLYTDNAYFSIENIKKEESSEFVSSYCKLYSSMLTKNIDSFLLLGGGTFSFLKYYLKHTSGKIDSVEIDKKLYDIACDYFNLKYNLELYDKDKNRSNIYFMDALDFIYETKKKYDGIFVDLFFGDNVNENIFKKDNLNQCLNLLNEKGYIMINYIHKQDNSLSELSNIYNALLSRLKNVKMITLNDMNPEIEGNVLIFGSNKKIKISDEINTREFNYELILKSKNAKKM